MLPTSSITMLDFAFVFLVVIVFCEALRILVVGIKNLQVRRDEATLDRGGADESLTKSDGG